MEVPLRRRHVGVPCFRHRGDRARAGDGVVRDGGVPEVVERPDVVGIPAAVSAFLSAGENVSAAYTELVKPPIHPGHGFPHMAGDLAR
jgi:hypothetical protein